MMKCLKNENEKLKKSFDTVVTCDANQFSHSFYLFHVLLRCLLTICSFLFIFLLPIEILQSSRYSRMTQSFISTEDSGIYQNIGEDLSRVNRGLNDALGPLPNIPINSSTTTQDSDKNWSRRMSGMSGIYEEITDPCHR